MKKWHVLYQQESLNYLNLIPYHSQTRNSRIELYGNILACIGKIGANISAFAYFVKAGKLPRYQE